ncbi:MAG TPA: carboxypeptidase-like regulatory domain-containing protein [Bryobacteraceae bacterium]|nr:carboxypeptidase-like regulatory domain-containing protein [Bryobacteraceae bacterium]
MTNAITQEPIAGVTVRVFGSNDTIETSTNASGVFRAAGLENCCLILFDKEGFEAVGPSRLTFRAAVNAPPLKLVMAPWPALRGRVVDTERHPIAGATVEAIDPTGARTTARTGSDGAFTFEHNIRPGDYVVVATPLTPQPTDSSELAPTYYPDSTERENAAKLTLKAGDDASGYDIIVQRAPVFRIAGRVVDERGEPARGAILQLATARAKATADEDGTFELPAVRPGTAVVQADWRRGDAALRGFTQVTVHNHNLDNVTVRVAPPMIVSGTVELDGKPALVEGSASLEAADGDGSGAVSSFNLSDFHFDGVYPGRYRARVQVHAGFGHSMYLDSVRLGERDITLDEFEIATGLAPLHVVLKTGGGRVRGAVEQGVGGIVVLVPQDERLRLPEFTATSFFSGGNFQVENVRPGDYYAFAVKGSFNQGHMSDPAYARMLLSNARPVRVENNGTATVSLVYVDDPSVQ